MSLANMREHGVRSVDAWCEDCNHEALVNVDSLPDDFPVPDVALRLRCSVCHSKRIGTRPNWREHIRENESRVAATAADAGADPLRQILPSFLLSHSHAETNAGCLGFPSMDERRLPSLALANDVFKLAIARDLQRIWSDVLNEPLPADLQRLIAKLERTAGGVAGARRHETQPAPRL
jgi:hypothetical protein